MYTLPFTYSWLIKKIINKQNIETILELGCGSGAFGDLVNNENKYRITGVDIFKPYLKICRDKGKYEKVLRGDLTKKMDFKNKSFDAVVCLQTIEHIEFEDGLSLLDQMEKISKKLIIVTTPNGECSQEEYDNNKYQHHQSSWTVNDFKKRGYRVFGTGLKWVYGTHSHAQQSMDIIKFPLYFLSFLMNPVTNQFPDIACQMVAIKSRK